MASGSNKVPRHGDTRIFTGLKNKMIIPKKKRTLRSQGFTLLEVVVALGMVGMLIGMIFRMSRTSIELSQSVVDEQSVTMERNAFFNLLKNHFEQIPGNAVVRLEPFEAGTGDVRRNLFELTFQNVPMSFNWGEVPMTAEAVQLATVVQRDGFVDVVLRFYDEQILEDSLEDPFATDTDPFAGPSEDPFATNTDPFAGPSEDPFAPDADPFADPVAEITLIDNMFMCECEVVDGRTLEQLAVWDNNGQLPLQVKFYCRFEPSSDIIEQTFWVVPKQNPEVIFRQIMQQNPAGPQAQQGSTTPRFGVPAGGGRGGDSRGKGDVLSGGRAGTSDGNKK